MSKYPVFVYCMKQWTHEVYAGKKSICDCELQGARVFLRVDYNLPISEAQVVDAEKIKRTIPTIVYMLKRGVAKIVVATHLGRPALCSDPTNAPEDGGVLPILHKLNEQMRETEYGELAEFQYVPLQKNEVQSPWIMVQNLRTLKVEKDKEDPESARLFDEFVHSNCDLMVNDGFGVMHRNDYSVTGVRLEKVAGLLVDQEMQGLSLLLRNARPSEEDTPGSDMVLRDLSDFIAQARQPDRFSFAKKKPIDLLIIGGAKFQDKIKLVTSLAGVASNIFLGGLLPLPFQDKSRWGEVLEIVSSMERNSTQLILPQDFVLVDGQKVSADKLPAESVEAVRDIGSRTVEVLERAIGQCNCVFWNGTVGLAEDRNFSAGTERILGSIRKRREILLEQTAPCVMAAGGGDTAGYVHAHGHTDAFDLVFTGGGAVLEALEGILLPGMLALADRM